MKNGKKVYLKEDGTIEEDPDKLPAIGAPGGPYGKKGAKAFGLGDGDDLLIDPDNETEE